MENIILRIKKTNLFVFFLLLLINPVMAQITWPAGQLLPSFSATAQTQDLIYMNEATAGTDGLVKWQAEDPLFGHNTGMLETGGWICKKGIHTPNDYMLNNAPLVTTVPGGTNTAEFRMMIDNNTSDSDAVVDIDVRNATTGTVLTTQTITRNQFSAKSTYVSFKMDFMMPADNQSLELRVFWRGNATIKVDWISVQPNYLITKNYLFSSLKGIVNKTQPRIFSYDGDAGGEGSHTWLESLGLGWVDYSNKWDLITKYKSEIAGLIVYDPTQIHTVNLATTLASSKNALVVSPLYLSKLTAAPYNFPILMDLRGQFTSKLDVYQKLYDTYWPDLDHRLLIGISPDYHQASLREYAVALGVGTIWLDPKVAGESELLNKFLASMPEGANFMGWWPEEQAGVTRTSQYGITTIASDYCTNLTNHSGMPRTINIKAIPPKPVLQYKIYVAFIISDGDNLQYVEHYMRKQWNNADRGSVPIGWTVSPAMVDAMPGALNYYYKTATINDNLISGPSGYGYTYPNFWTDVNKLNHFTAKTEEYIRRSGLQVVTIWNTITGGISRNVGENFARNAPSILGLTAQNTGGPLTVYGTSLLGFPLSCNYCWDEGNIKSHIASAATGWNRTEPRFIVIQVQPWQGINATNFKNVANSLNSDYVVVRPDHLFQLIRESKGFSTNPLPIASTGIVTAYNDCDYAGFSGGLELGEYNLARLKEIGILDNIISSLKVTKGFKAVLYQDDNFTGISKEITSDTPCLDATWNDNVSSIRITYNGDKGLGDMLYNIQNKLSGLYMDVWGSSLVDGANVAQGTPSGGQNQEFIFTHLGDGVYKIIAKHSGQSLDISGISKDNGANVQQYPYNATPNQQFYVVATEDGYYKIIPKHSDKLVEVSGFSMSNGGNVQQWADAGQFSGQWKLIPLTSLGLDDNELGSTINMYPNPTGDTLFFATEMEGSKLSIHSLTGSLLLDQKIDASNSVDVSKLKTGAYFVTIIKEGKQVVKKMVKK